MPTIKIEKVISFSSEDSICVASNILSNDSGKKWKCRLGEKSASLVLQLEKASIISNIDIGNENSAYIEVLVSRSGANDNFKVLLVMSSFMTPLEARQSTNINKVRMFTQDQLSKPERDEKWDRVKVVCTQPFNRHVQYGLSFINFHSPGEQIESTVNSHIGKFTLRPNSPDDLTIGSLFARRKQVEENTPLKAAAAIREASSASLLTGTKSPINQKKFKFSPVTPSNKPVVVNNGTSSPRNRHELLYTKDEDEPNKKIDEIVEKKTQERRQKEEKEERIKGGSTRDNHDVDTNQIKLKDVRSEKCEQNRKAGPSKDKRETSKRKLKESKETPSKKLKTYNPSKPFEQLLSGVIFVISGIQNPERANIRSIALAMGAKYKADWDDSCTHLICAFPNTPKFNQVRGKGKIIKAKWIHDCHSKRKRLPWRRYALDKKDQGKDESEEEVSEEIISPSKTTVSLYNEVSKNGKKASDSDSEIKVIQLSGEQTCVNVSDSENEENSVQNLNKNGTDTEDEIERIQVLQRKKDMDGQPDPYNVDTDEEDIGRANCLDHGVTLPDFFSNKTFYIDSNLNNVDKSLLLKYIVAFKGILTKDLNDRIDIVISSKELKFKNRNMVPLMNVVSSDYVWECHNSQKLLPVDNFKI